MTPTKFQFLLLLGATLLIPPTFGALTKIDPEFQKKIDDSPSSTWDVLLFFKNDNATITSIHAEVASLGPDTPQNMKAYETKVRMEKYAVETQSKALAGLRNFQKGRSSGGRSATLEQSLCWMINFRALYNAPRDVLYFLGDIEKPEFSNITKIVENVPLQIDPPEDVDFTVEPESADFVPSQKYRPMKETWGLDRIRAPVWWDAGFNGTGVIIGHIDTGADGRHPSLAWNWLGKGDGWKDPKEPKNTYPWEADKDIPHGTHTLGIAVGRGRGPHRRNVTEGEVDFFGVGVAPGARWISCQACRDGIHKCNPDHVCMCGQHMYCPNSTNNCRYRPDVVTVSMGCMQDRFQECVHKDYPYDVIVHFFTSSGIIPVFSAGNNKYGCSTVSDPEHKEVIKVGNIDKNERLSDSSGKGPPKWRYSNQEIIDEKIFKPDLVAPGTQIWSTIFTGKKSEYRYGYQSGTSMAAPHVAGAIALLLSRTRDLTYEQVRWILFNSTQPNHKLSSYSFALRCGGFNSTSPANHKFGWGRLKLPDPESLDKDYPEKRPTRVMPPLADYSDLDENSTPPSVRAGMGGVVIIAVFQMIYYIML